ncbi:MAG: HD domain-containing protein [Planctomycetes bacterium]|nr:HD domain-containing protein [Planctomycetota bacterium]
MKPAKRKPFHSIKTKLLIFGLCASLIPIALVTVVYYLNARSVVKRQTLEWLTAVAESRKAHTLEFMAANKGRTIDFSSDGFIRDNLEKINRGGFPKQDAAIALNKHLTLNKMPLDPTIGAIAIVDTDGKVVASTSGEWIGKDVSDSVSFSETIGKSPNEVYVVTRSYCSYVNNECLYFAAPIVSRDGVQPIGIIINCFYLTALTNIATNRAGMGETGEVYLVDSDGLMLTESRFTNDAVLKQVVDSKPIRSIRERNEEMAGIYPDYRGVSIVGASSHIPEYGWTLLAEIDKAEAFEPVERLRYIALIIGLVGAGVAAGVGIIFAVSTARPINKLKNVTDRLAAGDLKARADTNRNDEIGNLSNSFNSMAEELSKEIAWHKQSEKNLKVHADQQEVVAEVGLEALADVELSEVFAKAAVLIAKALEVEYCKVLELLPDGKTLLLRAGVGWKEGLVGHATVGAGIDSQAGYTLLSRDLVIVEDLGTEMRFRGPQLLIDHGVVSGMSAVIRCKYCKGEAFGVLGAHTTRKRTFSKDECNFLQTMVNLLATAAERRHGEQMLEQSASKVRQTLEGTIQALAATVETRDPYTFGHQQRVAALAYAIAEEMGLSPEEVEGIHIAGLIHDLGKITVPAEILSKPGGITDSEFGIIKDHPRVGYDILKGIEFPWPIDKMVLEHHERMDGSGYPLGLKGDESVMGARILAVADVVEAMSSHRPYRPTLGIDKALEEISKKRGILFDANVADACIRLFKEKGFEFKTEKS